MDNNEKYSCVDCIWHDQCESDQPCGFFDRGQYGVDLSDDEIEMETEIRRKEYSQAYQRYVQGF